MSLAWLRRVNGPVFRELKEVAKRAANPQALTATLRTEELDVSFRNLREQQPLAGTPCPWLLAASALPLQPLHPGSGSTPSPALDRETCSLVVAAATPQGWGLESAQLSKARICEDIRAHPWVASTLRAFSSPLGCQPAPPGTSGTADKTEREHTRVSTQKHMDLGEDGPPSPRPGRKKEKRKIHRAKTRDESCQMSLDG